MSRLWDFVAPPGADIAGELLARDGSVRLAELASASTFGGDLPALRGRSVLIAVRDQLAAALALIELDGLARRMVLCTPDLGPDSLSAVAATAEADTLVLDAAPFDRAAGHAATFSAGAGASLRPVVAAARPVAAPVDRRPQGIDTEWVLLTSGTTGLPKLVLHSLDTLGGALPRAATAARTVWSTFYDIRRYGGLQIFLRAVLSRLPLVLSSAGEDLRDFLSRAGAAGVTHISGTPSHWRRVLMSGDAALIDPEYVRSSGEVADQALLDNLHKVYPRARVAHAFASTEAGVAFDVDDGLEGFPETLVRQGGPIELKVVDQTLRIRSGRNAARYLGEAPALQSEDGYVDTGDIVELLNGRYHFRGRRGGVINVGGLKVFPEEVEAVINADPRVRMSLVRARKSPITGALVTAEVVTADPALSADPAAADALRSELLEACRRSLAAHKVPAKLKFVAALEVTPAGKLVRPGG